jgi:hypothetical protein
MNTTTNLSPAKAKHFCNPGDLIACMAALKSYYNQNKRKVLLLQQLNVDAAYYPSAVHGTTADNDPSKMVCMNQHIFDMIRR